jgi:hypothetical protein
VQHRNYQHDLLHRNLQSRSWHTMSIIQKSTIEWRVDDLSDGHLAVFT